jgi:hypothetical protein
MKTLMRNSKGRASSVVMDRLFHWPCFVSLGHGRYHMLQLEDAPASDEHDMPESQDGVVSQDGLLYDTHESVL